MRVKVALDMFAADLDPVSADHRDILAATPDWEVVGAVVFEGRVNFLVFVQERYFYQVSDIVFGHCNFEVPAHWRLATGIMDQVPGVSLLIGHRLIATEPALAARLVDMDSDALAKLRIALEQDERESA